MNSDRANDLSPLDYETQPVMATPALSPAARVIAGVMLIGFTIAGVIFFFLERDHLDGPLILMVIMACLFALMGWGLVIATRGIKAL